MQFGSGHPPPPLSSPCFLLLHLFRLVHVPFLVSLFGDMNEYVPPPFTISRSGLFKSLRTPPPLKLVATKRPATISKQRILDDNLTSFVSPKQWSNHKPHLPTKTIENQKKRILDFTFSESVDKNKNRDRDRDRVRRCHWRHRSFHLLTALPWIFHGAGEHYQLTNEDQVS
jgi:hypothetical protein